MEFLESMGQNYDASYVYTTKLLTNKDALELLKRNKHNRKVSKTRVREYKLAMENGKWQANGEPILIANNGTLLNGQHRLLSLAELEDDVKIPITIGVGMSPDSFDTIDTGKKRSPSDLLSLYGVDSREASTLAAGCKLLYKYLVTHELIAEENPILQNKEIYDFIQRKEYYDLFVEGIQKVLDNKPNLLLSPSESLFVYVLLVGLDREKGEAFCHQIFTQTGVEENTPVHILFGRLNRSANKGANIDKRTRIACTLKTWNYYIDNKPMSPAVISKSGIKDPDDIKANKPEVL